VKTPVEKPAEEKTVARRDPFDTLLTKARPGNAPPENLPPGKAGLIVDLLRIDGIVHGPNGMIAIVSNSQQRVYFLREGDKLYDGSVEKISLDGISFHEVGKDAFGKPLERVVTKRLYSIPGEQQ
jgi:Tfp pilus assembly protein PilP